MFILTKRPLHVLSNKLRRYMARPRQPIEWMKEKWTADFSRPERSCFIIKPEISYNANLEKSPSKKGSALFLGLKKKNCMAWLETEHRVYVDQITEARFRFDGFGSYCAAGIMFRVAGQGTYYLALISSKGYFRLDAVNNNIPRPLIGWTEVPGFGGNEANLTVIARSDHLTFFFNGRWFAEANDSSIPGGHFGFALVSYDSGAEKNTGAGYVCRAWLDFLSVNSRAGAVEAEHKKWRNGAEISAESRFRLAESFAALDRFDAAYHQILKTWEQREELARSVTATYTEMRTRGELLFAARMAAQLGQYTTAEEYINACLAMDTGSAEEPDVLAEKIKILSAQNKYSELSVFLPDYIKLMNTGRDRTGIPSLYALLGHACWNLQDYKAAAAAWDTAFSLDRKNGLYAAGAANAFEKMGKKKEALQRCLDAAQCALQQKDYAEMKALVPQLLTLGKDNRKARELAGKWAAGIGDIKQAKGTAAKKPAAGRSKAKPGPARKTTAKKPAVTAKAKTVTAKKPAAKTKPAAAKKPAAKTKVKTSGLKKKTKVS